MFPIESFNKDHCIREQHKHTLLCVKNCPKFVVCVLAENGGAGEVGTMVSNSEVESLRQEIAELRASTVSKEQYEQLKGDYQQLKETMERWQAKLLTDLMEEVDEEKKIRLATEVEMKRIKKMVQP